MNCDFGTEWNGQHLCEGTSDEWVNGEVVTREPLLPLTTWHGTSPDAEEGTRDVPSTSRAPHADVPRGQNGGRQGQCLIKDYPSPTRDKKTE